MTDPPPGCTFHPAVMLGCVLVLIVSAAAIVLLPWWLNLSLTLAVLLVAGIAWWRTGRAGAAGPGPPTA